MTHRTPTTAAATLFALATLAAATSPPAFSATTPPAVSLAGIAALHVATGGHPSADTPAAWVVFKTRQHVNPRLLVVRAQSRSGRSYRIAGRNCVRSTLVTSSGRIGLRAGRRYTVRFYARAGIGRRSPRTLIATRRLVARGFAVGARRRAPGCSVS